MKTLEKDDIVFVDYVEHWLVVENLEENNIFHVDYVDCPVTRNLDSDDVV